MDGPVYQYMAADHRRLEDALERAVRSGDTVEPTAFLEFRGGLLRHIGMEEKILLPAAQAAQGGQPLPMAAKLRLDHGALAALLVLPPTPAIVAAVLHILQRHNLLEEGAEGIYSQCESLTGFEGQAILARLQAAPPVAMAPYSDSPIAIQSAHNALKRAGHDLAF
jgi:hypothetical protein